MPEDKKEEEQRDSERLENIIAFAVVGMIILIFWGLWTNFGGFFTPDTNNPIVTTVIDNDPVKGSPDAPITIVEYSDFECPVCGAFYRDVLPQLEDSYINTGKVRLVYKQFPLTRIHPNSMDASIASECAFRQEKFWEYHDILFENQNALSEDNLTSHAEQAGLDMTRFNLCFSNRATEGGVSDDYSQGIQAGVTGTPAFVIGESDYPFKGELVVGVRPFSYFEELIKRYE